MNVCAASVENAMSHGVPPTWPSASLALIERVLDERSVLAEHLDALVAAIADVDLAVVGDRDAVRRVELLARRRRRA